MYHICIYWKQTSFKDKQILISPDWVFLPKNRGNREKFKFFLRGGSKFEKFLNLSFSIYLYYHSGCSVKILVKTKKIYLFYSIFFGQKDFSASSSSKDLDKKIFILCSTLHPEIGLSNGYWFEKSTASTQTLNSVKLLKFVALKLKDISPATL